VGGQEAGWLSLAKGGGIGVDARLVDHAQLLIHDALVGEVVVQQAIQKLPLLGRASCAGRPACKPHLAVHAILSDNSVAAPRRHGDTVRRCCRT